MQVTETKIKQAQAKGQRSDLLACRKENNVAGLQRQMEPGTQMPSEHSLGPLLFLLPFLSRILCLIEQSSISKQQATSRSTASLLIVFVIRWTLSLSHVQKSPGRILSRSARVTLSQWANQLSKGSITDELSLGPFPPLSQPIVNKRPCSVRTCGWVG